MRSLQDEKKPFLPLYFFLFGLLLRYFVGSYLKTPTIYWDELKYYGLARSIRNGAGLMVRNTTTNFQKILYPLLLSPLFAVKDTAIRLRLITIVNALLMNSCVFPLWKICSRLKVDERKKILLSALFILWPDLLMTETFMSENLYWPLFFWYIMLRFFPGKKNTILGGLAEGAMIYIGYLCKEVFAVFPAVTAICLLLENRLCPREREERRQEWRKLLLSAAVFGVLFMLGKLFLFPGFGKGYDQSDPAVLAESRSPLYLFYAAVYLLVSAVLSVQLLPVIVPILRFRRMETEQQRFFLYICVFIVFVVFGIAYAISIREDLGSMVPRIHLRYFAPAVFLLLPVLAVCPERPDGVPPEKDLTVLFVSAIAVFALFRTAEATDLDHTTLQWVCCLHVLLSEIFDPTSPFFWVFQVTEIILALAVSTGIYVYFSKRKKDFFYPFLLFLLLPVILSGFYGHYTIHKDYTARLAPYESVGRLSDYFSRTDDHVLYYTDNFQNFRYAKAWDCRYEPIERCYYLIYNCGFEVKDASGTPLIGSAYGYPPDTDVPVSDFVFSCYIDEGHFSKTDRIDYVVIPTEAKLAPENDRYFELVPSLSDSFLSVYRNKTPESLNIRNILLIRDEAEN